MGGPDMAPHTPNCSERPGGAVSLLWNSARLGGATLPHTQLLSLSAMGGPDTPSRLTVR